LARVAEARYAAAVLTQAPLPSRYNPRLIEAAMALNDNRLEIAERILKPYLKEDPFDAAAVRMLAELAARIGRIRDAEHLLRRAVELAPGWTAPKANLALLLGRMGRPAEAMALLDDVFAEEPEELGHWNLKAATLGRLGDFDEAIAMYEAVLRRAPNQAKVWMSYAHLLKTVGRLDEGIAAYRKAIELRRTLGEAWWSLANLKTIKFTAADIAAMQTALEAADVTDDDRLHLDFALGKAMHDAGRTDEAFAHYARANALRLKVHPYAPQDVHKSVERSIAAFTAEAFAQRPGGCESPEPIFIVGMPRSGSTLLEQILSSHSLVEGTSELQDITIMARRLEHYPRSALELTDEQRRELGEEYLRRTLVQRRTDKPFFVDKLPNNWMWVPFIHLILPNAKIIDARRHPLSCCFSNFRQHFAHGQTWSYDLEHLGRYYSDYAMLMEHVDRVLPGKVHRVIYERMVDDTETEVRRLLDYCGLEFEPACLEFYKTERAVRTPSSEQVRRPIYRDATEEWRAYDEYLGPLKEALGDVVGAYAGPTAAT
jgi:tetratricopeptide (TPR) repeat protein